VLTADPSWTREPEALSLEQIGLIRLHVKEVLASHAFAGPNAPRIFFSLIVEHALEGDVESLRERMIGAEMFGAPDRVRHRKRFRGPR